LAALDEVDAAISATSGRGGLKGKERNELEDRARDVRSALVDGDLDKARKAARDLAERIGNLDDDELDEDLASRLADATSALLDVLGRPD
jgi:hypothetical protein